MLFAVLFAKVYTVQLLHHIDSHHLKQQLVPGNSIDKPTPLPSLANHTLPILLLEHRYHLLSHYSYYQHYFFQHCQHVTFAAAIVFATTTTNTTTITTTFITLTAITITC